jgi:hypothetical protein
VRPTGTDRFDVVERELGGLSAIGANTHHPVDYLTPLFSAYAVSGGFPLPRSSCVGLFPDLVYIFRRPFSFPRFPAVGISDVPLTATFVTTFGVS